jgi:hypothetical protein
VQGSDVAVRNAAGIALGLLYQLCGLEVLPDNDDEVLDGLSDDGAASCASIDGSACAVSAEARSSLENGFEGIVTRMEALASNRCPPPTPFALAAVMNMYVHVARPQAQRCRFNECGGDVTRQ